MPPPISKIQLLVSLEQTEIDSTLGFRRIGHPPSSRIHPMRGAQRRDDQGNTETRPEESRENHRPFEQIQLHFHHFRSNTSCRR